MSRMCKIRPNCNGTSCDSHIIYSFPVEARTLDRDIVGITGSAAAGEPEPRITNFRC
jgi:hypothetical protein